MKGVQYAVYLALYTCTIVVSRRLFIVSLSVKISHFSTRLQMDSRVQINLHIIHKVCITSCRLARCGTIARTHYNVTTVLAYRTSHHSLNVFHWHHVYMDLSD